MATAPPDECDAMRRWMTALTTGPHELKSGTLKRGHRHLHYAYVPGTSAVVTYVALDVPVGVVTISSIVTIVK